MSPRGFGSLYIFGLTEAEACLPGRRLGERFHFPRILKREPRPEGRLLFPRHAWRSPPQVLLNAVVTECQRLRSSGRPSQKERRRLAAVTSD